MLNLSIPKPLLTYILNTIQTKYSMANYIIKCINYIAVNNISLEEIVNTPQYESKVENININNQKHNQINRGLYGRAKGFNKRGKDSSNNTM